MIYMTLVRGIPGSGKSTTAKHILFHARSAGRECMHYEADMFFVDCDGNYNFDQNCIADAHDWCRDSVYESLAAGEDVIVSNTFTTIRELRPYFNMAADFGIIPHVITCQSNFGSIHGVPAETIEKMKNRFVYDLSLLFESLTCRTEQN